MTKEKLIQTIKNLPEKFSVDDLLDRIILLHKIDIGLEQVKNGKINSEKQAKGKLKKWLK